MPKTLKPAPPQQSSLKDIWGAQAKRKVAAVPSTSEVNAADESTKRSPSYEIRVIHVSTDKADSRVFQAQRFGVCDIR